jgi:hypothetical protein
LLGKEEGSEAEPKQEESKCLRPCTLD